MNECEWCVDELTDQPPENPGTLCSAHAAEYDGLTEAQLARMDTDQWWDQQ
jgi:hypothetical protein